MKRLVCEICGGVDLIKDSGVFVCQSCGCKYSVEEVRKMIIKDGAEVSTPDATVSAKIDKPNQIENILENAKRLYSDGRFSDAQSSYKQILALDPDNVEAILYEGISMGWQGNLVNYTMQPATNSTIRALQIAGKNIETPEELETFALKCIFEITELGKAFAKLCNDSVSESIKNAGHVFDLLKSEFDLLKSEGVYLNVKYGEEAIAEAKADEKKYSEIKDTTYLLVMSVYEAALEILKEVEKYDLSTFDKIMEQLKECEINCDSYYQATVTIYERVLKNTQNKIEDKNEHLGKLEEQKSNEFWRGYKEERAQLEVKRNEFILEGTEHKRIIEKHNNAIIVLESKRDAVHPLEKSLKILRKEQEELYARKSAIGSFRGKEKKALDEEIKLKEQKISEFIGIIGTEKPKIKNKCDSKISEIIREKKFVEEELKQIEEYIKEIRKIVITCNIEMLRKGTILDVKVPHYESKILSELELYEEI